MKTDRTLIVAAIVGILIIAVQTAPLLLTAGCGKEPATPPAKTTPAPKEEVPVLFEAASLAGRTEKEVREIIGEPGDSWTREGYEDNAPHVFWRGRDAVAKAYGEQIEGLIAVYIEYDKDTNIVSKADFYFPEYGKPNAKRALKSLGIVEHYSWKEYELAHAEGYDTVETPNERFRGFRITYIWRKGELKDVNAVEIFY